MTIGTFASSLVGLQNVAIKTDTVVRANSVVALAVRWVTYIGAEAGTLIYI